MYFIQPVLPLQWDTFWKFIVTQKDFNQFYFKQLIYWWNYKNGSYTFCSIMLKNWILRNFFLDLKRGWTLGHTLVESLISFTIWNNIYLWNLKSLIRIIHFSYPFFENTKIFFSISLWNNYSSTWAEKFQSNTLHSRVTVFWLLVDHTLFWYYKLLFWKNWTIIVKSFENINPFCFRSLKRWNNFGSFVEKW